MTAYEHGEACRMAPPETSPRLAAVLPPPPADVSAASASRRLRSVSVNCAGHQKNISGGRKGLSPTPCGPHSPASVLRARNPTGQTFYVGFKWKWAQSPYSFFLLQLWITRSPSKKKKKGSPGFIYIHRDDTG